MMRSLFKPLWASFTCALLLSNATAQDPPATSVDVTALLAAISAQRLAIEADKKTVLDQFQVASQSCWQEFAVNDCLSKARRLKYQQLAPLDQREVALNAKQRELKELERQQRLMGKAPSKASS